MIPSLNEVESTVWKAARGAGLPWGLAEELAQAARWLARMGLAWADPLVACLREVERAGGNLPRPMPQGRTWTMPGLGAHGAALNPVLCGPLLSDLAMGGGEWCFRRVAQPLLLLPFAAWVARDLRLPVALSWPGVRFACDGSGFSGSPPEDATAEAGPVTFSVEARPGSPLAEAPAPSLRRAIPPELWNQLEAWAKRTYVPASASSRLAGAGAGLTDND